MRNLFFVIVNIMESFREAEERERMENDRGIEVESVREKTEKRENRQKREKRQNRLRKQK